MSREQRQVASGMAAATLLVLATGASCVITGWHPQIVGSGASDRLLYGLACTLPVAACLAAAIASVAAYRFFTPDDIGGAGLTPGTAELRVRSAILQNTLEQAALAIPVYLAAAMMLPERLLGMVAAASILFVIGRVGFARGYRGGAAKRAFGFAVGFYASIFLMLASLITIARN